MLHDHAQRIRDDYARGNKAMGGEPTKVEDMGDITITGDIQVSDGKTLKELLAELRKTKPTEPQTQPTPQPQPSPVPQPQQPTPQQPPAKTAWQKAWPWLLAAAIPASGAGGALVANYMSKPPAVQDQDTWFEWDFQATPSGGDGNDN